MDTQTPVPPPAQNPVSATPTVQSAPIVTQSSGSKNKMIMIVVGLAIVLVALIAGGAYYYMNMQQSTTPPAPITPPTSEIQPTPAPLSPEEQLNAVSIDDGANDFSAVDKDLQNL